MDQLAQAAMGWNFNVFKEPRGFIKLIQFIIAIFAFATTTSMSSYSDFSYKCTNSSEVEFEKIDISYPFRLSDSSIRLPLCSPTAAQKETELCCDFNSSAQFYVFVGVIVFLYCIAALIVYVCFSDKYQQNSYVPTADFVVSAVFVLLWLIASSAWADGVRKLKIYSDPEDMWFDMNITECKNPGSICSVKSTGNFANLNVSILFGFLNVVVWGGNLWFLYKETKWFASRQNSDLEQSAYPTPPPQSM